MSKSLLFYYFRNQRELYLFLIKTAADTTYQYLQDFGCGKSEDFFENMHRGLKAKVALTKKYPSAACVIIAYIKYLKKDIAA